MFLAKVLRTCAIAAVVLAGLQLDAAADPIVYDGTLTSGTPATGQIPPGFAFYDARGADYWAFWATAGDSVSVIVNRLDAGLDPAQFVFSGKYANTLDTGLTAGTNDLHAGTNFIDFGDDERPPALPGPFGDPLSTFTASTTGWYTVAVTSFASNGNTGNDNAYDYEIIMRGATGSPVPEPTLLALFACGACGVVVSRRRKKSA